MKKTILALLVAIFTIVASAAIAESAPIFVKMDTLTVNLTSDGTDHYLQTDIELKLPNVRVSEKVKEHATEIHNNLVLLLSSKSATSLSSIKGKQVLSSEIKSQVNRVLHGHDEEDSVSEVFFTSFTLQ